METNLSRETRIDCPVELDDPKDHAVTRGRDVSLRHEGGHSPEHDTVSMDTTDDQQRQHESPRPDESEAEPFVVNYSAEVPEHLPRNDDHEVAQAE